MVPAVPATHGLIKSTNMTHINLPTRHAHVLQPNSQEFVGRMHPIHPHIKSCLVNSTRFCSPCPVVKKILGSHAAAHIQHTCHSLTRSPHTSHINLPTRHAHKLTSHVLIKLFLIASHQSYLDSPRRLQLFSSRTFDMLRHSHPKNSWSRWNLTRTCLTLFWSQSFFELTRRARSRSINTHVTHMLVNFLLAGLRCNSHAHAPCKTYAPLPDES